MRHASYLQADQDIDFLNLDETRGVRLQIDYQKAELLLQQHGIEHTIVVFGSTRIKEPAAAQRVVDNLRIQLDEHPDDTELGRQLLVAERILAKSCYYDVARAFGRLVSEAGRRIGDGQLVIMTGGGPGMMEAANRGAYDAGSEINTELNGDIPGPGCGSPGMGPDEHEPIAMHDGILGVGDLDPATWGWEGPVARVTVRRLAPAYTVTLENLAPATLEGGSQVFSPYTVLAFSPA